MANNPENNPPESKKTIGKQIKLPITDAIRISSKNIRIRFGRSIITIGGIFLGIAFLMSVLTSSTINNVLFAQGTEEIRLSIAKISQNIKERQIWIVILSLLVCVVGITNAMLMSVTERYREIGTMKCLGALNRFIIELFLLESSFQGLVGSFLGAVAGMTAVVIINFAKYGGIVFSLFPLLALLKYLILCSSLGVFLSVIGAIYPAYIAAKMVPADAMRATI
jgi:cell division protein FtsX